MEERIELELWAEPCCDIIGDQIEYKLFKVTWLSINTINTSGDQLVSSSGFVWLKAWEVLVQDRQQFAFRSLGLNVAHNSKSMEWSQVMVAHTRL